MQKGNDAPQGFQMSKEVNSGVARDPLTLFLLVEPALFRGKCRLRLTLLRSQLRLVPSIGLRDPFLPLESEDGTHPCTHAGCGTRSQDRAPKSGIRPEVVSHCGIVRPGGRVSGV